MTPTPGPVSNARTPSISPCGGTTVTLPMPPRFWRPRHSDPEAKSMASAIETRGRALPARGDIAHAEIADDIDSRALGDYRRLRQSATSSGRARARWSVRARRSRKCRRARFPLPPSLLSRHPRANPPRSKFSRQYSAGVPPPRAALSRERCAGVYERDV